MILAAAASTSILLTAFYRVTQSPDSYKRHHVYGDDDGEAVPAEYDGTRDRTARVSIAFFALAAFLLSAWNWTIHIHGSALATITVSWVCCLPSYPLAFLTRSTDDHHFGLLLACSTIASKTTTLRYWSADSGLITHFVSRVGNNYLQAILGSSYVLGSSCARTFPCLRMLFFATAT